MANILNTGGPDTFAVNPLETPIAGPDTAFAGVQAGLQGGNLGGPSRTAGIDFSTLGQSSTLDSLLRLGEKALSPRVAAERNKQIGEGAIAAVQGMSAKEIAKGDMFDGIFGDPTAVAAAREVEKVTALESALTSVQANMKEWQTKSPGEFKQALPDILKQHLTGDPLSDSLITNAFVQKIPALTDSHMRASVKYQNDQARRIFEQKMYQDAIGFEAELSGAVGPSSPESVAQAQGRFLESLSGSLGVFGEAHMGKAAFALMRKLGNGGHVASMKLLANSPLVAELTPEQQALVPKMVDEAVDNWRLHAPEFEATADNIGRVEAAASDGRMGMKEVLKFYGAVNRAFPKALDTKWITARARDIEREEGQRLKRIADDRLKGDDTAMYQNFIAGTLRSKGDLSLTPSGGTAAGVDLAINARYLTLGTQQERDAFALQVIAGQGTLPDEPRREVGILLTAMKNGRVSPEAAQLVQKVAHLYNASPSGFAKNFGRDDSIMMRVAYDDGLLAMSPADPSYAKVLASVVEKASAKVQTAPVRRASTELQSRVNGLVTSGWLSNTWNRVFSGKKPLTSEQEKYLSSAVSARAAVLAEQYVGLDEDQIAELALNEVQASNDSFAGLVIENQYVKTPKPLYNAVARHLSSGTQLDEVSYYNAQVAALEAKLQLEARKSNNQDTDYTIASIRYDPYLGLRGEVKFDDNLQRVPFAITPQEIALEYGKTPKQRKPKQVSSDINYPLMP